MNSTRTVAISLMLMATAGAFAQNEKLEMKDGSAVATALAFTHQHGKPATLAPGKDRQLKLALIASLTKSPDLPWDAVRDIFDSSTFQKHSGGGSTITMATMETLVRNSIPKARKDMHAKTRLHADLLSMQFDLIEEAHREPAQRLVDWIVKNYQADKSLGVIIICTGNTRRSMLGATMGNIAAAYHGLNLRFASGGTEPDAFNPRTIATLKDIGVIIEPIGKNAPSGSAGRPNPIYRVNWGKGQETLEFSKKYTDPQNPQKDFAAIMVCSEADAACPKVTGASIRIPVPYLDPKAFDGAAFEAGKYAERRDDVGRFMLSVCMQARRQLEIDGKVK